MLFNLGYDNKKFIVGSEICSGGYATIYSCKNDQTKVIKAEIVGRRSPKDFFKEVIN